MTVTYAAIHDYALDGDEDWQIGDIVNLHEHDLDPEDRLWRLTHRDGEGGYWFFVPTDQR